MENRDRDKMSKRDQPTEAGKVNRETSERQSDSDLEFGEKIGRSEDPDRTSRDENSTRGRIMTGRNSESNH